MSEIVGDIRYAARQLVRQPLYSFVIVLLMALAIAGNAAVFRVFNGLFLKPLPFHESGQLVDLDETAPAWDLEFLSVMYRDFVAWREANSTFESMALYSEGGGNFVGEGSARRVTTLLATHDLDDVLRLEPLMGRFLEPAEDTPDGPRAAVLSEGFWQREFGGDPDVLGRTISIDGFPIEVVGILPPEARYFGQHDLWLPLRGDVDVTGSWSYNGVGRLRADVTPEQALADLTSIHKGLVDERPVNDISSPVITPLRDRFLGEYRLGAGFLLGAVGIVLLIACANIAGLMAVRAMARSQEMGIRRAMGAPKGRIVRQLLTESFVLAGIGALVGGGLGYWGSEFLVRPLAEQFPAFVRFDLDLRFFLFTLAITAGAAIGFGLAPALRAAGASEAGALSNRSTTGRRRKRAIGLLVAGEVALALVLLVVGGLSSLDVRQLGRTDPGFDAEGVVSFRLNLPSQRYEDSPARLAFAERYLQELDAVPGVESAAIASSLPLGGHWGWFFTAQAAP
ncbi:MAG: FtsX-like permease family protein, partial [Gemmatimonadetes bacterium]|nr:FtsX-like permease family protein [Gemmatimonadota bacterium]